jgi:AcrR family transcriptional regulator
MRGRPPSIREEEILDAARDVFCEEGHATTTAKIAKRARVSQGILFYRYQSKEALLAAVIHRETQPPERLRDIAKHAAERSVVENLERVVETLLDSVFRAHPFLELAMTSPTSGEIHRLLFANTKKPPPEQVVELLAGYFATEIRLGRIRAVDTGAAARAIFGGCIDYVRSGQASRDPDDRRAFVRGLVDILAHGTIKPVQSRRPRRQG